MTSKTETETDFSEWAKAWDAKYLPVKDIQVGVSDSVPLGDKVG